MSLAIRNGMQLRRCCGCSLKKALEAGEESIADEIVDELYSLSDCGCTLEDKAVKADLEMLEKYGFGSRADKARELCLE